MENTIDSSDATNIKDDHDLRALAHSCWGESAVARAKAAVLGYYGETADDGERFALRFFVNKRESAASPGPDVTDDHLQKYGRFEAWTPYRMCTYVGETPEQAIANMLHGVADLARSGHMDPNQPDAVGQTPIQHAMAVLTDRLKWQIDRRNEAIRHLNAGPDGEGKSDDDVTDATVERHDRLIASLGTAIAALARVNDL